MQRRGLESGPTASPNQHPSTRGLRGRVGRQHGRLPVLGIPFADNELHDVLLISFGVTVYSLRATFGDAPPSLPDRQVQYATLKDVVC